jgi:probable phosphoglycerate mutase
VTNFLLIRHALHLFGGHRIAGRTRDVHLSPAGLAQADALAERLATVPLHALYRSPMERTDETQRPLAARHRLEAIVSAAFDELDYGDWTGRTLDELRSDEHWRRWNSFRSGTRVPNGESMLDVQTRVVSEMQRLCDLHPDRNVAIVSHGDVIKAALAYCAGVALDMFQRIEISPASVSVVQVAEHGAWVLCVNNTDSLAELPVF